MYHINKIFAIALIVFLTGCSIGGEKKIKIFQVEEPRKNLDYPMPTALQLEKIKWIIITSENAQEVFAKLEQFDFLYILITGNFRLILPSAFT